MNTNHARKWDYASTVTRAQPKRQVYVKKVHKQGWITKGEKILYLIVGICLIMACYFIVSYASANDTLNRELQSLENEIQEQEMINETLVYKRAELIDPARIIEIAKENGLKIQDAELKQVQAYHDSGN